MISNEAVYAAAQAVYGSGFDGSSQRDAWLADFRKALEAAAPHIIATALREAADELEYGNPIGQWLCDRADELEGEK